MEDSVCIKIESAFAFRDLSITLAAQKLIPASNQFLAILMLIEIYKAQKTSQPINKTRLFASLPNNCGSMTRLRYVLQSLESLGTIYSTPGNKKTEKYLALSPNANEVLNAR